MIFTIAFHTPALSDYGAVFLLWSLPAGNVKACKMWHNSDFDAKRLLAE